jgi:hypothetical protein
MLEGESTDRRIPRALNEEIEEVTGPRLDGGARLFACECENDGCAQSVEMTLDEYAAVRERGGFIVAPGHARDKRDEVAPTTLGDE